MLYLYPDICLLSVFYWHSVGAGIQACSQELMDAEGNIEAEGEYWRKDCRSVSLSVCHIHHELYLTLDLFYDAIFV